jgi:hypothetical protein
VHGEFQNSSVISCALRDLARIVRVRDLAIIFLHLLATMALSFANTRLALSGETSSRLEPGLSATTSTCTRAGGAASDLNKERTKR